MSKNTYAVSFAALLLVACTQLPAALAQNSVPSGWEMNQQNAINQEAASGMLNGTQASQLQNREAQIQQQQAAMAAQNGGTLTQGEKQQIGRELRGVNHQMGRDMRYDQMQNGGGMVNPMSQMFPNNPGAWRGNPMWQNGQQMPMVSPQQWAAQNGGQVPMMTQQGQWQNANGQWQNGQVPGQWPHHHHHGQYNNGGGFGSANGGFFGGNNNNNFQGRNWNGNPQP